MSHSPHLREARDDGQVLVVALLCLTLLSTIVFGSLQLARERTIEQRISENSYAAELAASSAVEAEIAQINEAKELASSGAPWELIDNLDTNAATGPGGFTQVTNGAELRDLNGTVVAEYDVFVDIETAGANQRFITVTAHAYVPSKDAYAGGSKQATRSDASSVVEVSYEGSEVFDYSYFINHWGWFFGDTITANGNVRSNGVFDFGNYRSTINGSPRYAASDGHKLVGYMDDNGDGVKDGSDGGVYAGLDIANESRIRGMGRLDKNQHVLYETAEMPNLSNLSPYEESAIEKGGTIQVGGQAIVSGVLGDESGEQQHLYLIGTDANPIVLDGPVVVRGSVIIGGKVTGQGSIYAGGNVYIPKNLEYLNGPSTSRPASNDQSTVEAWREDALSRDSLGLFAREHVVIGNYMDSNWQYYVNHWVNDSNNESAEDAGIDGIHNTRNGADGIYGTADDDVLEGDGEWTVSRYTEEDASRGLIPAGSSVGDVIPGTGEDIDGDGQYDGRTQMSEFNLPASLKPENWAGLSTNISSYSNVATIYLNRIDSALYTNHTLAALMLASGQIIQFNGTIVSRNESIIYGASGVAMNHDERLSGRGSDTSGFETPLTWNPVRVVHSEQDAGDLPAGTSQDPAAIGQYYTGGAST